MDISEINEVIDSIPIGIILIDAQEWVVAMNTQAISLLGSGGVGRHYLSVLRQPNAASVIERTIETKKQSEGWFDHTISGKRTRFQITCTPVSSSKQLSRYCVSLQDISEQHSAGQIRRDFVANVSHELRTPLTALIGFIETLRGAARDDPQSRDRFLSIMEREANRMNRLIRDLLSLSRIEGQEWQRPKGRADLHSAVQSAIDTLSGRANERNVTVKFNCFAPEVLLTGDADQLQQMFSNLIENAIKYGWSDSVVTVTIHPKANNPRLRGDGYKIEIQDQGDGIAEEHLTRLMERFYRVDTHRSREMGGTGLGLAIVKHIVNRHRGYIRIQSNVGQGSIFCVWLPVSQHPDSR